MATKKASIKSDGSFKTVGEDFSHIIPELEKELKVSFDAHFVASKILEFGKILTGIPLYRYQEAMAYRIIYAVITLEGTTVSMLLSRQSGKSETLAFVINTLSVILPAISSYFPELSTFENGLKVGLFAPQSDQVFMTYNRALLRLNTSNASMVMGDPDLQVGLEKSTKYFLTNGSEMTGQVASKQSKIEGASYHLIICEEAQDLDTYIVQKSIEPMVSAYNGTIVKCGTTGTQKNDFWYEIEYNKKVSRGLKDHRLDLHFQYNYKAIFADKRYQYQKDGKIFHLLYEKDVSKKEQKWGRESQAFKLSYALEWDMDSGMLINDKQWSQMQNRKMSLGNFTERDFMVAGIDIGKEINSTVITIGKFVYVEDDGDTVLKRHVVAWHELRGLDYEQQHFAIVQILQDYNVASVSIDYTGVGKAVVDRLEYSIGEFIHINPFTFSRQSKSDMWYNMLSLIDSKALVIPASKASQDTPEWQRFCEQLTNCKKWYDNSYLCAEGDEYDDDFVDSLGLMCLSGNVDEVPEIEMDTFNPFYDNNIKNMDLVKTLRR